MRIKPIAVLRLLAAGCLATILPITGYAQQPGNRPGGGQQGGDRPAQKPGGRPGGNPGQKPGPNPGSKPGTKPGPQPGNRPGGGKPGPQPGNRPAPKPPQNGNRPGQGARPNPGNRPAPRPPAQQHRPPSHRPPSHRPPQWGRPPANRQSYNFRSGDRDRLRRYYASRFGSINRANRPRFYRGSYFPYGYISYLSPIPGDIYGYLPPPPPGYQMGYYDGYVVVYDPLTYFIANVIDLMQ